MKNAVQNVFFTNIYSDGQTALIPERVPRFVGPHLRVTKVISSFTDSLLTVQFVEIHILLITFSLRANICEGMRKQFIKLSVLGNELIAL